MPLFRRRSSSTIVLEREPDRRFRLFGGRRHLAAMPYPLPKDLAEVNRLDFQHYILRYGFQGNFAAPITSAQSVLDVGCGSGRWAMEVATYFPQANVVGLDLVPPTGNEEQTLGQGIDRRPENVRFLPGNILEGLPFPDKSFDFVHQRLLITAIPKERWSFVIQELTRVTRIGGWVELAECGVPQDGGPGYTNLWDSWIRFCATRGVDFTMGHTLGGLLRAGGLANVEQRTLRFPMGAYGGRIGKMSATDCLAVGRTLRQGVVATGVLPEEMYDRYYAMAQAEFEQPTGTGVLPFYVAYGQRVV